MADYTKTVNGGSGTMLIRDTGGVVEFHITAGNGSSWDYDLGWSWTANGATSSANFRYPPGAGWQKLGDVYVGSSQYVTFHKDDSNSTGLGGATDFVVWIQRSTVPAAPSIPSFSIIRHQSVVTNFVGYSDGGSPILEWQVSFGPNRNVIENNGNAFYPSNGQNYFTGLKPGTLYAAWARGRNANGWGPWGGGNAFTTLPGCYVKINGAYKLAVPYVNVGGIWKSAVPHVKDNGVWKSAAT